MDYTYRKGKISYPNKELTILDKIVINFISNINIDYVLVRGYVIILFGGSRNTKDIDILIRKMTYTKFCKFYENITKSK